LADTADFDQYEIGLWTGPVVPDAEERLKSLPAVGLCAVQSPQLSELAKV